MRLSNLNTNSKEAFDNLAKRIVDEKGFEFLKQICANKKIKANDSSVEAKKFFLIATINPLTYEWAGSKYAESDPRSTKKYETYHLDTKETTVEEYKQAVPLSEDPYKTQYFIGYTKDNTRRLWILNWCDSNNLPYFQYRPEKGNWYFHAFIENYKVKIVEVPDTEGYLSRGRVKYRKPSLNFLPTDEKRDFVDVKVKNLFVMDITNIKQDFVDWDKYVKEQEEAKAARKKAYEEELARKAREREEAEAAYKKRQSEFEEYVKDWTYLGSSTPCGGFSKEMEDLYNKIKADKSAKWESYDYYERELAGHRGREFSGYWLCPKYKVYFFEAGDSTD